VSLTLESSQKKWLEDCGLPINDNINWNAAYLLAKKCTKSTKLIEFQFKFLHIRLKVHGPDYKTNFGGRYKPLSRFSILPTE